MNTPKTSTDDKSLLECFIDVRDQKSEILEWSVFNKSKSVVNEMMHENEHDTETSKIFWNSVANEFPKWKLEKEKIDFYLHKFFNWFEDVWFSQEHKDSFMEKLKEAHKLIIGWNQDESKKLLEENIIGTIEKNIHWSISPDARKWLDTFINFFEDNLDGILEI